MAIRRPPTTFSDTISTADIADDAISGDKLANDIAISTTGNIATTGSGTLTSAGAFTASGGIANSGTITAGTLGSSVVFPTGHVIQTVSTLYGTATNVSGSYQDSGATLAITPSSTSNKIFVFFNVDNYFYKNGTDGRAGAKIVRTIGGSATDVLEQATTGFYIDGNGSDKNTYTRTTLSIIDSPNTISAATYKLQVKTSGATHVSINNGTGTTVMLMEIKG